ncbi:PREDICTED: TMV resistance [Prunus dulcis]|uniref:PREDICTED: TMV resistance n=1 Tax=Prunus dulcis TaxID=3755 RepID=A0A5E4EWD6_PRUDU|nr:disease resistance protein RUN1-like [Prunus dulcis]VVA19480.1 PREDICTED: TMV resistance [Prunus dulcis]
MDQLMSAYCKSRNFGISGIGKTPIAKLVYNSNFRKFEGSSFIENIREISQHTHGLVKIQRQLLYGILNGIKVKIHSIIEGISKIDVITSKGVLLVLDDVDHVDQLDAVLRMKNRFYRGSKIVITTRRSRLLKGHRITKVLDVETLDYDESLELFGWYAFGQDYPIEGYLEYSEKAMYHCGGLALSFTLFSIG